MAIALTILTTTVLGIPIALALGRARRLATLGAAFLLGSGTIFVVMLALSLAHVPWSLTNITAIALVISVACAAVASRRIIPHPSPLIAHVGDLATILTAGGFAVFATLAPVGEWDFWAIWGLKARVFAGAGGIDWRFLESRWNDFVHPDYPLLLPMNYAYATLANGGWSDRWLGLYTVAFGVAALLVIRDLVADEMPPLAASFVPFAATAFVLSGFIGLAEAPLIAFATSAVLYLRRRDYTIAAILLGLAASSKNEGLSFFVAVIVAMLVFDRRNVLRLWPAAVIAAPWLVLRRLHMLTTDLARGSIVDRLIVRVQHTGGILRLLVSNAPDAATWLLIVAALALTVRQWKRERLVLLAVAIQLAFLTGAYFVTNREVAWHVATSWPRLTRQIAAPLIVIVMLMLARTFAAEDDLAHAEARPDL